VPAPRPFIRLAISDDNFDHRVLIDLRWERPLSDEDKIAATEELSNLKPLIEAGHISPLYHALWLIKIWELALPDWVYTAIGNLIEKEASRDRRRLAKGRQRWSDRVRWATVKYLKQSGRLSWEAAYHEAALHLGGGSAAGSEETIRASYKRHQHDSYVELLKKASPEAVNEYARETYEFMRERNFGRKWIP
jgi:hypothetical protein